MTDVAHPEYVLGHAAAELDRLVRQAAFFGDLTAHTLKLAGLGPGMRVLDVGCGAGDVSLLAASIVGPSGSVTGVDLNADAVTFARTRIEGAKIPNITVEAGDITKLPYAAEFDAVIGRLVLMYLGDPGRRNPGVSKLPEARRVDLFPGVLCARRDVGAAGARRTSRPVTTLRRPLHGRRSTLYTGMHLARIYRDAGLPAPAMLGMSRVESGPDSPAYEYMAQTVRSLLPLIEQDGRRHRRRDSNRHARRAHARRDGGVERDAAPA